MKLPDACGVYLLKDKDGHIIYIGKSKSIKKRVSAHFRTKLGSKICSVDHILTKGELSALILEARLIKKYKPRYNISMRDDKQYPYIKLTISEDYPALSIARTKDDDGSVYFGRFRSGAAGLLLKTASRIFGLRKCSSGVFKKRRQPCLNYYMKKCQAPCIGAISKKDYAVKACQAKKFLEAGPEKLAEEMKKLMEEASANSKFELAADLRDKLYRIEESIDSPFKQRQRVKSRNNKGSMQDLMHRLCLDKLPARIEAFDISNTGASQTVGAMVVFVNGDPFKAHYRKFKISTQSLPDDTAAVYETVFRRYSGSLKDQLPLPDIVVVDGGSGQRSSAEKALKDAGISDLKLISIAKKNEDIYISNNEPPLVLPKDSKAMLLLRSLRDEAHRFAISYHRSRRQKAMFS
ncbi:MAG: excinuclease ABC subunit UvrC [Candidatus Margulisiibacteriota bacterium]